MFMHSGQGKELFPAMKHTSQHEHGVCVFVCCLSVPLFICVPVFFAKYQRHTQGREITWPHPVQSALTLADKGIWVRLKLRKEPEDLASAETDDEHCTRDTGRC